MSAFLPFSLTFGSVLLLVPTLLGLCWVVARSGELTGLICCTFFFLLGYFLSCDFGCMFFCSLIFGLLMVARCYYGC